ncbi:hypothetical protein BCL57_001172 [Agromyces flavus]|uniref:Uncharacterized protein n=1 Tax=Agromyces flavus TaxID=589382 RepID=A0A1H1ZCB4_9MICO|nr:hypothetical protein [Agromyces flavus]MCP2367018.1 hypothetical protein [Agromyces flavus]GGI46564.1 hypothetical protein GCM10010932_15250 [Agromyces flavus]SDT31142.1 hypothetical protein SAMN04489721_3097 [Agromyces flavus]
MGRVRLVRGHGVQLVRWRPAEHGWVADVRRGRRLAEDADGWTVLIAGRTQRFERSEWTEFIGELVPPGAARRTPLPETEPAPGDGDVNPDVTLQGTDDDGTSIYARSSPLIEIPSTRPIFEPSRDSPDAGTPGGEPAP